MEHYYFHYRYYTIPIVIQTWQGQQASIFRELKEMGGGLILSGDCRLVSMLIIVSARPIGMAIDYVFVCVSIAIRHIFQILPISHIPS